MNKSENFSFEKLSTGKIRLVCLILIGILDISAMTLAESVYADFSQLTVFYMNMLAMFYLGVTISHPISRTARNILITGLLFCAWPLIMQLRDFKFMLNPEHPLGRFLNYTFLCSYIVMFSFAAVAEERNDARGLKYFTWIYGIASAILVILIMLYLRGFIPAGLENFMYWKDSRLYVIWNPNITSRILMLGIGFCLIYLCAVQKIWLKTLLVVAILVFSAALSLTDTRTVLIMLSCMIGGILFFCIYKRNWKTFLLGLFSAMIAALLFFTSVHGIYKLYWNYQDHRLQASEITVTENIAPETLAPETVVPETAVPETAVPETAAPETTVPETAVSETAVPETAVPETAVPKTTQPVKTQAEKSLESRASKHFILNAGGRVPIWKGVLKGLSDNPRYILTGIRDPDILPFINDYSGRPQPHSHNSWLQILLEMGIIGLGFALYFTWLALKSAFHLLFCKKSLLYQKAACILTLAIMGTEFFEPFLFLPDYPKDFMNLAFMLLLGYLIYWDRIAEPLKSKENTSK